MGDMQLQEEKTNEDYFKNSYALVFIKAPWDSPFPRGKIGNIMKCNKNFTYDVLL